MRSISPHGAGPHDKGAEDGDGAAARARRRTRSTAAALALIALTAALPLLIGPGQHRANAAVDRCSAPADLLALDPSLPHLIRRLKQGRTLTIVALGSSSTAGAGASGPQFSYPSRLAILLGRRFPKLRLRVVNRGVGGEEADAMARRINRQVLPERPDLVIWQVGTNGVLHDADPVTLAEVVRRGIARIKAAGSDVLLMNLQYAPAVLRHADYRDMLQRLNAAARAEGVPVFHRFAMMRQWAEDGQMPLPVLLAPDHLHMSDASYDCLARELTASFARAAAGSAPAVTAATVPRA